LVAAASSIRIEKVAEEMLLCEVIVQRKICRKHRENNLLMRVPCSRTAKLLSGAAAADELLRYSSVYSLGLPANNERTGYG
jgi:hypothetical protein